MRDTEREALEDFLTDSRWDHAYDLSYVITESDWLAAHDAQVRADEREKIAVAIEAMDAQYDVMSVDGRTGTVGRVSKGSLQLKADAARIARSGGESNG